MTLNLKQGSKTFEKPVVMGILNTTDDSFYDGGKYHTIDLALRHCEKMLEEGAEIIDVGGQSTRPGADIVDLETELKRTVPVCEAIIKEWPDALISIDSYRAEVVKRCVQAGASIINDISAGDDDPDMLDTVAELGVPYIAMHKKGVSKTMQDNPVYSDVVEEILGYFEQKVKKISSLGIRDLILDPGFGFGKTLKDNYRLMNGLDVFHTFKRPLLIGVSRKSMIWRLLEISPKEALNGTTGLNMFALMKGVHILRVHDVKQAVELVKIHQALDRSMT